ncbi:MAG: iron-sulfur cluster assembly scaffold protein [Candidatus Delongbacteria bacterium]|nr:iron-sulfur cluster assembly scaffold protein [Candidatus Delongbacteria bacterium]MBN2836643.1 iron-sulfur cluster assembly scaffold protein [Candidatus Delongbacteria bacterium]
MYSQTYMKHFSNPQNVGKIENADDVIEVINKEEGCFDTVNLYIKYDDNIINDAKFQLKACSGTIVTFSLFTELIKGKEIEFLNKIDHDLINDELGGLPAKKAHSIRLVLEARDEILKRKNKE